MYAETGETPLEMCLHGRDLEIEQLRDLGERPSVAVYKHDSDALALAQPAQCAQQLRLDPRVHPIAASVQHAELSLASPTLAHPVQVAHRVLDALETVAVLPRPRERLRRRLPAHLEPVRGHKSPAQPRLGLSKEQLECPVSVSAGRARVGGHHTDLDRPEGHSYHTILQGFSTWHHLASVELQILLQPVPTVGPGNREAIHRLADSYRGWCE